MDATRELNVAIRAAQTAGKILLSHFGAPQPVRHKGERDLVTDVDEEAEHAIVAEIRRAFPHDRILAEEGTTGGDDPHRLWLIDPLDGTTNYAHGYPVFAVSIALEIDGVVQVGVVSQPVLGELFTAIRGRGAHLNGRPIRVSETGELRSSLLCSGFPYERAEIPRALAAWSALVLRAQAVRRDGAAAIDLCYVAAGRFDGFWERTLKPWDLAAGGLIVAEAGGRLTNYHGARFDIREGEVLATNGRIHDEVLGVLADVRRSAP